MAIFATLLLAALLLPAASNIVNVSSKELKLGSTIVGGFDGQQLHLLSDAQAQRSDSTGIAEGLSAVASRQVLEIRPAQEASLAMGASLSVFGGTCYALGALIVSWATRAKESSQAISDRRHSIISFIAWMTMNIGGLSVTFAYQSGASVPLMNAFVYSTNLGLNMVFQIIFKLSQYTKNMRVGTILFALAALQLGQLAPPPEKVEFDLLYTPQSIAWNVLFLIVFAGSAVQVWRNRGLPRNSSTKIMMWSLHVACWGSFTDNWAKINGTLDGTLYWIVFVPYLPAGMWVMVLSVWAMAATNVAIYVPANLCMQLVMNTLSALLIWNEAERVDLLVAYLVGYCICILGVYIATEEADLMASYSNSREVSSRGLSRGKAVTPFGESLVNLAQHWGLVKQPQAQEDDSLARKSAIQDALLKGADAKVFGKEELMELSLLLWARVNASYAPLGTVMTWLQKTPYFEDYLAADPEFQNVMMGSLSQDEQRIMVEEQQIEMTNMAWQQSVI